MRRFEQLSHEELSLLERALRDRQNIDEEHGGREERVAQSQSLQVEISEERNIRLVG